MKRVTKILAAGALFWTFSAALARDMDFETCGSDRAPAAQVEAACTRILGRRAPLSNKNRASALTDRAYAYINVGEYDKGISDCTEAIRLKADNPFSFNNRGFAYTGKGEYDKAISDYNEAAKPMPGRASTTKRYQTIAGRSD